jgi:Ni,Fe-hydrogenase I small subunit
MARFFLLLGALALALVAAEPAPEVKEACAAKKVKELKAFLAQKGKSCHGCSEKGDFVSACQDAWDLPDAPPKAAPKEERSGEGKEKSMEELLASLKGMPGMENIKIMRPEDMMKDMKKEL